MTPQEINEGNALLAKYLGGKVTTHQSLNIKIVEIDYTWYLTEQQDWHGRNLQFHTSWDWIMRVVKRISNFDTNKLTKESEGWYAYNALETYLFDVDIEMVFKTCVNFIKWNNENNKS